MSRLGCSSSPSHKYIPRRAVLYVPGNDEKKINKIPSLNVDCAVLDCEDGVAVNKKVTAWFFLMAEKRNALKFGSIAHYLERVYHIHCLLITNIFMGFPGGSDSKESTCNAKDPGLIPGSGRSPGEGNGNLLLYSWLAWTEELVGYSLWGCKESNMTEQLRTIYQHAIYSWLALVWVLNVYGSFLQETGGIQPEYI